MVNSLGIVVSSRQVKVARTNLSIRDNKHFGVIAEMVSTSSRSKKVQEMMDKAGPDMKEIYREKVADAKRMEESMRNEETIKHELEKVRDILSEANEQLAGNKGRLLLVLLSYHKAG